MLNKIKDRVQIEATILNALLLNSFDKSLCQRIKQVIHNVQSMTQ